MLIQCDQFNLQNNAQLKKLAGDLRVKVEQREQAGRFGTGKLPKLVMSFAEFLDRVDNTELLYLTTQYDEDDEENVHASADVDDADDDHHGDGKTKKKKTQQFDPDAPMQRLSDVFPNPTLGLIDELDIHPKLLGHLVLQQSALACGVYTRTCPLPNLRIHLCSQFVDGK